MAKVDLWAWALKGAEQRLVEIAEEAKAIFSVFPELRGRGRGFENRSVRGPRRGNRTGARRGKRTMSAAARKAVSERMKKYWAARRKAK